MAPGQGSEFGRQGERQQEVLGGHLFFELTLQPLLAFMVLTVGTAAMPARVRHEDLAIAVGALCLHQGTCRSPAVLHHSQGMALGRQYPLLVLRQEIGFKALDNRGEQDHLAFPHAMEKPFINALMASRALCCVPDVRWVYFAVVRIE